MQASDKTFRQIINTSIQFIVPVFQRDYRWAEEQCGQLWTDIMAAQNRSGKGGHFLGSIVHIDTGRSTPSLSSWLVIDGQQRLATLTILLVALRDHIHETNSSNNEDGPTEELLDDFFLKNKHATGNQKYKLTLRRMDDVTLRCLVDGNSIATLSDTPSPLILNAYSFFREQLRESNYDLNSLYDGIASVRVVEVTLDRESDDPQLVFESLNSTGVDLTQSDLVRNFLLMRLQEQEQTRLYTEYWSRIETYFQRSGTEFDSFLRDYIALRQQATREVQQHVIYDAFKTLYQEQSASTPLEKLLEDMVRFAGYYAAFRGRGIGVPEALKEHLSNVRVFGDTSALLVMRLFDCYENNTLSLGEFNNALQLVETYLVRRAVGVLRTNSYWRIFAGMAFRLDDEAPLKSLETLFVQQQGRYLFPTDDEFKEHLESTEVYHLRVCKFLLDRLENAGYTEKSPTSSYSIEHIMPQNENLSSEWQSMLGKKQWKEIQATWLHRLGNLTLTGYNSLYSDRKFEEKKTIPKGFNQSAVRLNEFVRTQEAWGVAEMTQRATLLAERALQIWRYPVPDPEYARARERHALEERAAAMGLDDLGLGPNLKLLLQGIDDEVRDFGQTIRIIEGNCVCYFNPQNDRDPRGADFFMEVVPFRDEWLRLLLDLSMDEFEDVANLTIGDVSNHKFVVRATNRYEYRIDAYVADSSQVEAVIPMVRRAYQLAGS